MNWDCQPYGEIDILGKSEHKWIFIDVKTVYKTTIHQNGKNIDHKNMIKLGNSISQLRNDIEENMDFRVDNVIVNLTKTGPEIKYYKGIHLE